MRILYVVNNPSFFVSHRLPLGLASQQEGFDVHVATPTGPSVKIILDSGFNYHVLPMVRIKANLFSEIRTMLALFSLYRKLKPDIIHHVTIKPVLYGTMAAQLARVRCVVNAISGLGYVFIQPKLRGRILSRFAKILYRVCLRHSRQKVIFQNPDDAKIFLIERIIRKDEIVLIRGSGVDLQKFRYVPQPPGIPLVVLPARMLRDKGVVEFYEAARILKSSGVIARFILIGDTDEGNPASLTIEELKVWVATGIIEWWGFRQDMAEIFATTHIICLPSYREGLSKVLIEAAASGRPIVTTDVPGCRDVVQNKINGLLVPARDALRLAEALKCLIEDHHLREQMGTFSRKLAEGEFSLGRVIEEHLQLYRDLLG